MEKNQQVTVAEIEKEFEPVIGYKSIKNEMIKICDIMRNSEFYYKQEPNSFGLCRARIKSW